MKVLQHVLSIGIPLVTVIFVVSGVWRWNEAHDRLVSATAHYTSVQRDGAAIRVLRQKVERVSFRAKPTDDLIPLVHESLRQAGLPADRLADLRNESDVALPGARAGDGVNGGPNYRRQSVAFTLRAMSPGDLGAFLNAWRSEQAVWTVSRLTLTAPRNRDPRNDSQNNAGRFDIALVVSSLYFGDA